MHKEITELGTMVLEGGSVTPEQAVIFNNADGADIFLLSAWGAKIRETFLGNTVDLCSIVSARTGGCSEDCSFCAQSAHNDAKINVSVNLDAEDILKKAKAAEAAGVHRFDIVTSGRGYTLRDGEFQTILHIFRKLRKETSIHLCACLGTLGVEEASALADTGVTRYNHNLETAESFFSHIISTHSYAERVATIKAAKSAGLEVCVGGIIGLGETFEQRMEFAFALRELGVDSVPINVLNPIAGTPLEKTPRLKPMDIIKTMAAFRFILPRTNLRLAGGRELNLRSLQALGLVSGMNGMLTGNYLTTEGQGVNPDLAMLDDLGLTR